MANNTICVDGLTGSSPHTKCESSINIQTAPNKILFFYQTFSEREKKCMKKSKRAAKVIQADFHIYCFFLLLLANGKWASTIHPIEWLATFCKWFRWNSGSQRVYQPTNRINKLHEATKKNTQEKNIRASPLNPGAGADVFLLCCHLCAVCMTICIITGR